VSAGTQQGIFFSILPLTWPFLIALLLLNKGHRNDTYQVGFYFCLLQDFRQFLTFALLLPNTTSLLRGETTISSSSVIQSRQLTLQIPASPGVSYKRGSDLFWKLEVKEQTQYSAILRCRRRRRRRTHRFHHKTVCLLFLFLIPSMISPSEQ
jgi:hypothetical protein